MDPVYITVVGFSNYHGREPFRIDAEFRCEKEPENPFDNEAIKVTLPALGTVGYIANSVHSRAGGTMSAGRIYDRIGQHCTIRVCFTTHTKIIARITDFGQAHEA